MTEPEKKKLRLLTVKEIMTETQRSERAVRDQIKKGKWIFSGALRKMEKLYYSAEEQKPGQTSPTGETKPETYNTLRELERSGDITPDEAGRLANLVDALVRARKLDPKVLEREAKELDVQAQQVMVAKQQLDAAKESWANDQATLQAERDELEGMKTEIEATLEKINLIKKWCADTVKILTSSDTFKEAYHAEGSTLPSWPENVNEQEVTTWADLAVAKVGKRKAKRA